MRIAKSTFLMMFLFWYFHLLKTMVFLFILMSIHESMHVLCAIKLGYKIEKIVVYPFGLCASIVDFEYKDSWDEIKITVSGLSVHLIAAFFIPFCSVIGFSSSFVQYMEKANIALLCFNCFPIYPLDGGRLLRNVLELFLPFKRAKYCTCFLSILFFVVGMQRLPFTELQKGFFCFLFGMQYVLLFVNNQGDLSNFYLYRLLQEEKKNIKIHSLHDVYKNKKNVYNCKGILRSEKDVLQEWI